CPPLRPVSSWVATGLPPPLRGEQKRLLGQRCAAVQTGRSRRTANAIALPAPLHSGGQLSIRLAVSQIDLPDLRLDHLLRDATPVAQDLRYRHRRQGETLGSLLEQTNPLLKDLDVPP